MSFERRFHSMGIIAVFLCSLILSSCSSGGSHNSPPPNPVSQQPQGSAPASSPPALIPSSPHPQFLDFPDIPIPSELKLRDKDSYTFQSGSMKAGLLTLRGRVDLNSVINFFQMAMPRENWKSKGGFRYRRSVLIFEKPDKTCIINLYEGHYYCYVEIYVAPVTGQI